MGDGRIPDLGGNRTPEPINSFLLEYLESPTNRPPVATEKNNEQDLPAVLAVDLPPGLPYRPDPLDNIAFAQLHVNEMEALRRLPANEKVSVPDDKGGLTSVTARERLSQLPGLIDKEFTAAVLRADARDPQKAQALLLAIDTAMQSRQKEIVRLNGQDDIFQPSNRRFLDTKNPMLRTSNPLDTFNMQELQLLRFKTEQYIQAPRTVREQMAAYLADTGDLKRADKLLNEAERSRLGPMFLSADLHEDVRHRLRRQELAGGEDALETARLASRQLAYKDMNASRPLFDKALSQADRIDTGSLKARQQEIEAQLKNPMLIAAKREELTRDQLCIEELLHARAAVRFSAVVQAAADGRYGEVRSLMDQSAAIDPEFTAQRANLYLDMMLFAKTEGKQNSVFEFHNNLVKFQRHIGPAAFNLESAAQDLESAAQQVKALPIEEINKVKNLQSGKVDALKDELAKASGEKEKTEIQKQLDEAKTALDGIKLLQHAPAYTQLMKGVFALANKKYPDALQIFNEIEKMDPEFAKQSETQLKELREFALKPITAPQEQSFLKGLLKELMYSAAAIAAGALVVVATGWSGPAALAAGFAAGAAVRSGLKYAVEGELKWYDPLVGGIDGLSGGAGALMYRSAYSGLSASAKAAAASERALAATGMNSAALEGLSGAEKVATAERLAAEGLKEMGKNLPWTTRVASRIPYTAFGNAEYRSGIAALNTLTKLNRTNMLLSNLAGGATTALIHRGRIYAPDVWNGKYNDIGAFSKDFLGDVAGDTAFSGLGGPVFRGWPFASPAYSPLIYGSRNLLWDQPQAELRLEEIDRIIAELNEPTSPQQIRRWYLQMPGPKVELYPRAGK